MCKNLVQNYIKKEIYHGDPKVLTSNIENQNFNVHQCMFCTWILDNNELFLFVLLKIENQLII